MEEVRFIRTRLATDWPERSNSLFIKLLRRMSAIPNYEPHLHQFVEFDDNGYPGREIGLDETGRPVLAGPDERNYGFWLDTNMKLADFEGESISRDAFERKWNAWHAEVKESG